MVAMKTDGIEEKELQPNIPDETTVPGKRKGSKTTVETRPDSRPHLQKPSATTVMTNV